MIWLIPKQVKLWNLDREILIKFSHGWELLYIWSYKSNKQCDNVLKCCEISWFEYLRIIDHIFPLCWLLSNLTVLHFTKLTEYHIDINSLGPFLSSNGRSERRIRLILEMYFWIFLDLQTIQGTWSSTFKRNRTIYREYQNDYATNRPICGSHAMDEWKRLCSTKGKKVDPTALNCSTVFIFAGAPCFNFNLKQKNRMINQY